MQSVSNIQIIFFLVADKNTEKLLNKSVLSKIPNFIITSNSVASLDIVELIQNKTKNKELIVAFGSSTVNDVCKYASYLEGTDYISFPTAASMNGYIYANASILINGQKKVIQRTSCKSNIHSYQYTYQFTITLNIEWLCRFHFSFNNSG